MNHTSMRSVSSAMGRPQGAEWTSAEPEAQFVARLRSGDEGAFETLLHEYTGRLLCVARRMLGREEEAQDAVQEAFLNAYRALQSFDGRSQLSTWLHRITINACLMKLRTRRRKPEVPIEDFLPTFVADGHQTRSSVMWNPEPASGIETEETQELVRSCINQLPEAYRVVLMLRDIEDINTEDTAEILGMTEAAVKTRLHRARQALRGLLDPHFVKGSL